MYKPAAMIINSTDATINHRTGNFLYKVLNRNIIIRNRLMTIPAITPSEKLRSRDRHRLRKNIPTFALHNQHLSK
ncbi:hypothetical protein D3C87_1665880 [compost metagenome]